MKNITAILLIFLLAACTNNESSDTMQVPVRPPDVQPGRYNVAILIMDGTYNTELTAPYDIFQHTIFREVAKPMNVFLVANTLEPVTTFEGIRLLPDFNYLTDSLPPIDILVVPSAEHHVDTDLEDARMIDFVKKTAEQALFVTSHCDGAFVLAKTGLPDLAESTTFPGDIATYRKMFPQLTVHEGVWFVHDGKYITSAGGARSFEAALYLCEVLYGKEVARRLAQGLVIDWDVEAVPKVIVE
jgi:transcriptional regulator GlxA family with amidase domain